MEIFDFEYELDAVTLYATRQMVIDRLIFLALSGFAIPVLQRLIRIAPAADVALTTHAVVNVRPEKEFCVSIKETTAHRLLCRTGRHCVFDVNCLVPLSLQLLLSTAPPYSAAYIEGIMSLLDLQNVCSAIMRRVRPWCRPFGSRQDFYLMLSHKSPFPSNRWHNESLTLISVRIC
jgi:hypothetical protein